MSARDLGTDLLVVPHLAAHDAAGIDLVGRRVTRRRGTRGEERSDLRVVSGRENLAQALILRLLTPRGSLAALGHAAYGSRLHELIGRPKTNALRNLCRAFVLEAVAQEPRVEDRAVALGFDLEAETLDSLALRLVVQPRDGGDSLELSAEVQL